jgi:molybdopterin converting factor small subunit
VQKLIRGKLLMALQVFLAATLRKYFQGYDGAVGLSLEVSPGATVLDVARELAIPEEEVKLIMVNGIGSKWSTVLRGDERVAFFPPVGGG